VKSGTLDGTAQRSRNPAEVVPCCCGPNSSLLLASVADHRALTSRYPSRVKTVHPAQECPAESTPGEGRMPRAH
jgi:hypothetical protein